MFLCSKSQKKCNELISQVNPSWNLWVVQIQNKNGNSCAENSRYSHCIAIIGEKNCNCKRRTLKSMYENSKQLVFQDSMCLVLVEPMNTCCMEIYRLHFQSPYNAGCWRYKQIYWSTVALVERFVLRWHSKCDTDFPIPICWCKLNSVFTLSHTFCVTVKVLQSSRTNEFSQNGHFMWFARAEKLVKRM